MVFYILLDSNDTTILGLSENLDNIVEINLLKILYWNRTKPTAFDESSLEEGVKFFREQINSVLPEEESKFTHDKIRRDHAFEQFQNIDSYTINLVKQFSERFIQLRSELIFFVYDNIFDSFTLVNFDTKQTIESSILNQFNELWQKYRDYGIPNYENLESR